jgi:hypothetical protein
MQNLKDCYEVIVESNWDLTNKVYSLQCAIGKPNHKMEHRLKGVGENRLKLANVIFSPLRSRLGLLLIVVWLARLGLRGRMLLMG